MQGVELLIAVAAVMGGILLSISALAYMYSMRSIKNKTVGDGQHGTATGVTALPTMMTIMWFRLRFRGKHSV